MCLCLATLRSFLGDVDGLTLGFGCLFFGVVVVCLGVSYGSVLSKCRLDVLEWIVFCWFGWW